MKHKRMIGRAAACLLSLCLAAALFLPTFSAENYNDEWVADYENMKKHVTPIYTVPTLFKNDTAYSNNRRFPLVVQGGIDYIPIEMFSGMANISVNAGYSVTNFYITNSKAKTYISFDAENDLVTTQELTPYKLVTKLFYDTRYVPAKEVADVLKLTVEVYNDPENGVYALRLSDGKQKLSFAEVIKNYSPIKKSDTAETPPEKTPDTDNTPAVTPDKTPDTEKTPDKTNEPPDIGRRTVYLSFDVTSYPYIGTILQTLEKENLTAAFFVSPADIPEQSDAIRMILSYGQPLGILLGRTDPAGDYAAGVENLSLVAKCTTHLVRFTGGSRSTTLSDEQYKALIEENGLRVWDYNVSATDSAVMYDTVYSSLYSLAGTYGTELAILRLYPGRYTPQTLSRLSTLFGQKKQLTPAALTESAGPVYYRKIKD